MLVVHGGAGSWPDDDLPAAGEGVDDALAAGWRILDQGGSAVDAVEAAVMAFEDNPLFNAGYGSVLTAGGRIQMDALIMDGATLGAGAVACVEHVRHPIQLARRILAEGKHVLYAGPDADRLAERFGFETCANEALISDRARARRHRSTDTVGAVALDQDGNLASATSTGGISGKQPGRVGDSPIIGAGGYADNGSGAISATGTGEAIMRLVLARWTAERLLAGHTPQQAAEAAATYLKERLNGDGGLIVLDRTGRWGTAHNTPRMPWGVRSPAGEQLGS